MQKYLLKGAKQAPNAGLGPIISSRTLGLSEIINFLEKVFQISAELGFTNIRRVTLKLNE